MTIGMLGAVAALGLWGVVLGLGFAETSVAEKSNTELAAVAASGGVPEAVAAATGAGTTKKRCMRVSLACTRSPRMSRSFH